MNNTFFCRNFPAIGSRCKKAKNYFQVCNSWTQIRNMLTGSVKKNLQFQMKSFLVGTIWIFRVFPYSNGYDKDWFFVIMVEIKLRFSQNISVIATFSKSLNFTSILELEKYILPFGPNSYVVFPNNFGKNKY